jgi:ATP/maltotriose-dependent transcriptional regulator MalT
LLQLGKLHFYDGDNDGAKRYLEECVEFNREKNDSKGEAMALGILVKIASNEGDQKLASKLHRERKKAWEKFNC